MDKDQDKLRKNSEVPLPQDRLILIDLDKTLLDINYNLTDEKVLAEISRVQSLGWQVGLSSDTPLEPLKVWADKFGIKGPVLAEKGSILYIPEVGEFILSDTEKFFKDLKKSFIGELVSRKVPYLHGDATQFLRNNPKLPDMVDERVVTINAYRRCSFSFFTRKINKEGFLKKDAQFAQEVAEFTRPLWSKTSFRLIEDSNPEYGIYILAPEKTSKRDGTMRLMEKLSFHKIGIIGDSIGDIVGNDIAIHYAVGNATEELAKVADYSAKAKYASGVAEILKLIKN